MSHFDESGKFIPDNEEVGRPGVEATPDWQFPSTKETEAEKEAREAKNLKPTRVQPKLKKTFDNSSIGEHLSIQTVEDLKCFYMWVFEHQPGLAKRFNKVRHGIE